MKHLLILILSLSSFVLMSQTENKDTFIKNLEFSPLSPNEHRGVSVHATFGTYIVGGRRGIGYGYGVELNVYRSRMLYSFEYYKFDELFLFDNSAHRNQLGFKVGSHFSSPLFRFKYQIGLAYFSGENQGYYFRNDPKEISTVGFTAKVGFEYMPMSTLSLGLDLERNKNSSGDYMMPLLKIGFGLVRPKRYATEL